MEDIFAEIFKQVLQTLPLEWIASITGFVCVYLASQQNILNWPISIISVGTYLYIFYTHKLYGDAILQVYFLTTALYGWYYWNKNNRSSSKPLIALSAIQSIFTVLITTILGWLASFLLQAYTDSDVPYLDGYCTAMSLVAQFLLTRKVLQNWLLWILVDFCYIPLYLYKELYLTALLYFILAIIAWQGYVAWKKVYQKF